VFPEVQAAVDEAMIKCGNPSSGHHFGREVGEGKIFWQTKKVFFIIHVSMI
jgi:hypothetical protein